MDSTSKKKKPEKHSDVWFTQGVKDQTVTFINHVYDKYYKSYDRESDRFGKIHNCLYVLITVMGFLTTILIGLQKILEEYICAEVKLMMTVCIFLLPSISSVLLLYMNQKGFKRKFELREEARIHSKYLINEAKLRFSVAVQDKEYEDVYRWLNSEIKNLQESQAQSYIKAHNITEKN
ncbi:hypothetical protein [Chryseobacterium sp. Mn2064]|uniref:hypothetical protein n=1 Tax=Chryseobacterium sp. Mn2064 TaxID=3395263 RepID=UPI003BE05F37